MARIVVIGGSAGSIEPLRAIVRSLDPGFPAVILVAIHTMPDATSVLPRLLERAGRLPARHATGHEVIQPGRIYVAPPDHHLVVSRGAVSVSRGPRENSHRPAIDVLFRSAADAYGPSVIAVLLSGVGGDGASGMYMVKQHGGTTVVQHPDEALFTMMLTQAAQLAKPDYELPVEQIGPLLAGLTRGKPPGGEMAMPSHEHRFDPTRDIADKQPSPYSCPECGGVLWEDEEGQLFSLRCRVGHVYSYDSLLAEQTHGLESALWAGLRALEEKASLLRKMAESSQARGQNFAAARFERGAREMDGPAEILRRLLDDGRLYAMPQRDEEEDGLPQT
jgi:two-component system chemotaxis response regulator CheB